MLKTNRKRPRNLPRSLFISRKLLVFSLASCFRLLFALNAGLLIVFSLAKLGEDAGTSHCTLKATKCAIQGFAFFYSNFCHFLFSLPPHIARDNQNQIVLYTIYLSLSIVFYNFLNYFTTIFTILPGTTISLTIVFPSRSSAILSSAFAAARAVSLSASAGMSIFAFTLPLT